MAAVNIDQFNDKIKELGMIKGKEECCQFIMKMMEIMALVYLKRPSLSRSETVYNVKLIFPCLEALISYMKDSVLEPYFVPGEEELLAMIAQLEKFKNFNKQKIYKVDGAIRLNKLDDLEILVLETAGPFKVDEHTKIAFDNSKEMFALLAMLKTIADKYTYTSVDEFRKLKLYFVQPSDDCIRLWSMSYNKNGLYHFVREEKLIISEDFDQKANHLLQSVNFFFSLKTRLEKTIDQSVFLKRQHEENLSGYDSEANSQVVLLSEIICPKIFKIT